MKTPDCIEFEEKQKPDLDDDEEDTLQSNDMRSPSSYSENSIPTHSRTNSDLKEKKKKAEWNDQEVQSLILLWSRFEVLFNAKHPLYYNKEEKGKALNKIKEGLELNGWIFSTKDIADKIVDLRNFYGAQRRIVEACKKGGAGANETYESNWKFFNQLNFLNDNLIPRNSKRNISSSALCSPENVESVYQLESIRSTKSKQKMEENQISELQGVAS